MRSKAQKAAAARGATKRKESGVSDVFQKDASALDKSVRQHTKRPADHIISPAGRKKGTANKHKRRSREVLCEADVIEAGRQRNTKQPEMWTYSGDIRKHGTDKDASRSHEDKKRDEAQRQLKEMRKQIQQKCVDVQLEKGNYAKYVEDLMELLASASASAEDVESACEKLESSEAQEKALELDNLYKRVADLEAVVEKLQGENRDLLYSNIMPRYMDRFACTCLCLKPHAYTTIITPSATAKLVGLWQLRLWPKPSTKRTAPPLSTAQPILIISTYSRRA